VQDHPGDGPERPSTGARERPANRTASSAEAAEGTAELIERLAGTHAYAPSRDLLGRRTDTTRGTDRRLRDCRDRQEALHLTGIES
jgi:hypothetical protein